MKEGYYKIIEKDLEHSNGQIIHKQFINYYNLQKAFQFQEFYFGEIRPEFNVELTEE